MWHSAVRPLTEFEIYKVNNKVGALTRDLKAKLVISNTLDSIRTRFFEVIKVTDSLDYKAHERLLKR